MVSIEEAAKKLASKTGMSYEEAKSYLEDLAFSAIEQIMEGYYGDYDYYYENGRYVGISQEGKRVAEELIQETYGKGKVDWPVYTSGGTIVTSSGRVLRRKSGPKPRWVELKGKQKVEVIKEALTKIYSAQPTKVEELIKQIKKFENLKQPQMIGQLLKGIVNIQAAKTELLKQYGEGKEKIEKQFDELLKQARDLFSKPNTYVVYEGQKFRSYAEFEKYILSRKSQMLSELERQYREGLEHIGKAESELFRQARQLGYELEELEKTRRRAITLKAMEEQKKLQEEMWLENPVARFFQAAVAGTEEIRRGIIKRLGLESRAGESLLERAPRAILRYTISLPFAVVEAPLTVASITSQVTWKALELASKKKEIEEKYGIKVGAKDIALWSFTEGTMEFFEKTEKAIRVKVVEDIDPLEMFIGAAGGTAAMMAAHAALKPKVEIETGRPITEIKLKGIEPEYGVWEIEKTIPIKVRTKRLFGLLTTKEDLGVIEVKGKGVIFKSPLESPLTSVGKIKPGVKIKISGKRMSPEKAIELLKKSTEHPAWRMIGEIKAEVRGEFGKSLRQMIEKELKTGRVISRIFWGEESPGILRIGKGFVISEKLPEKMKYELSWVERKGPLASVKEVQRKKVTIEDEFLRTEYIVGKERGVTELGEKFERRYIWPIRKEQKIEELSLVEEIKPKLKTLKPKEDITAEMGAFWKRLAEKDYQKNLEFFMKEMDRLSGKLPREPKMKEPTVSYRIKTRTLQRQKIRPIEVVEEPIVYSEEVPIGITGPKVEIPSEIRMPSETGPKIATSLLVKPTISDKTNGHRIRRSAPKIRDLMRIRPGARIEIRERVFKDLFSKTKQKHGFMPKIEEIQFVPFASSVRTRVGEITAQKQKVQTKVVGPQPQTDIKIDVRLGMPKPKIDISFKRKKRRQRKRKKRSREKWEEWLEKIDWRKLLWG